MNENYSALGFDSESEDDFESLFADAAFAEGPVYRSVSAMTFQEQDLDTVYRSLKVSESCPSHHAGFMFENSCMENLTPLKETEFAASKSKSDLENISCMPMTRKLANYFPSAIFTYSDVEDCSLLVGRFENVLSESMVDFKHFDNEKSCLSCKIVVDSVDFRFDIYILELLEEDKQEQHANYIVEVQRLSSSGCASTWSSIVDRLMSQISELCTGGYFDHIVAPKKIGGGLTRSTSIFQNFIDDEEDDDIQMTFVDEETMKSEHLAMLDCACNSNSWQSRIEMAQLLAKLSTEKETAKSLVSVGAVDQLIKSLQANGLTSNKNEVVRAFCSILGNLATHLAEVDVSCSLSHVVSATTHVINNADIHDKFDLELLREAARALSMFTKHIREHQLRDQVRSAAKRCIESNDKRLCSNANIILRNLQLAC